MRYLTSCLSLLLTTAAVCAGPIHPSANSNGLFVLNAYDPSGFKNNEPQTLIFNNSLLFIGNDPMTQWNPPSYQPTLFNLTDGVLQVWHPDYLKQRTIWVVWLRGVKSAFTYMYLSGEGGTNIPYSGGAVSTGFGIHKNRLTYNGTTNFEIDKGFADGNDGEATPAAWYIPGPSDVGCQECVKVTMQVERCLHWGFNQTLQYKPYCLDKQ